MANAVMDGSDAVMLSAETAVGSNPVEAVRTMASVAVGAEKHERFSRAANYRIDDVFNHVDEAIAMASMYTANHLDVKAIAAMTESGSTSLWMSRVRASCTMNMQPGTRKAPEPATPAPTTTPAAVLRKSLREIF